MARAVQLTRYQADDGALFEQEADAEQRNADIRRAAEVEGPIGPRLKLGHGSHVVHNPMQVRAFHRGLVAWSRERMPDLACWKNVSADGDEVHRSSIVARIASESDGPLRDLWWRRGCIDNAGREWDQPYFANEADEGRLPDA